MELKLLEVRLIGGKMKQDIIGLMRCVNCGRGKIELVQKDSSPEIQNGMMRCCQCLHAYEITGGVAILLKGKELQRVPEKVREVKYYDESISPRPDERQNLCYGLGLSFKRPKLHTDMYNFYLNRIQKDITKSLKGRTILDLGCGAGQEAEFFAKICKARVVGLDISSGSAKAAKNRSDHFKYDLQFDAVVGDMEEIPFADKSIDFCLTHTSLHHAVNPDKALSEMARVAKEALIISSESINSIAIKVALLLGFTTEYESNESGNRVWRPTKKDLYQYLNRLGAKRIVMRSHFFNTSEKIRWGRMIGKSIRPVTSILESEFFLKVQDSILGSVGNSIFVMAEL